MRRPPLIIAIAVAVAPLAAAKASKPRDAAAAATLAEPLERPRRVVAGEHVWYCEGASCRGLAGPSEAARSKTCRRLARRAGKLLSFEAGGRALGAAEIAACNR